MKIMVFLQGTIIQHKNAACHSREDIIRQVIEQEESVRDFVNYIPIGYAAKKLQKWASRGAEICYLSALTMDKKARRDEFLGKDGLKADQIVLDRCGFPKGTIYHRDPGENYKDVVERAAPHPDVLIEDDCQSIGGESEMTFPSLGFEFKQKIKSVIVKEFEGIDHLSDNPDLL